MPHWDFSRGLLNMPRPSGHAHSEDQLLPLTPTAVRHSGNEKHRQGKPLA